jgi:hypothetical protein
MMAAHSPNMSAGVLTLDLLTPSQILNEKNISHTSIIKNSISCIQKTDSSDEDISNDPDCVPTSDNKKKSFMFATEIASSSPTSPLRISTTELASVWYTTKELKEIVEHAKFAIQIARLSETVTNGDESFRGLEDGLSTQASQESKARKIGVAQAVLNEQKRQRTVGVLDTSRMRMMANKISRKSKNLALELAEQDAKEVLEREDPSVRPAGKGRGLQNHLPRRDNTRTKSLRRLSSFDAKRLGDKTKSLRHLSDFDAMRLGDKTESQRRLSSFDAKKLGDTTKSLRRFSSFDDKKLGDKTKSLMGISDGDAKKLGDKTKSQRRSSVF